MIAMQSIIKMKIFLPRIRAQGEQKAQGIKQKLVERKNKEGEEKRFFHLFIH